ncbi:T9SS type A sorting domain-containing protein [Calditrichota bacterium]
MKTFFNNKKIIAVFIFVLLFITCNYFFESVNQPDLATPNSTFDVEVVVRLEDENKGGLPYFGIRLPTGWTVKDSIQYSGILSGTLVYSAAMSDSMEIGHQSPPGYYWWVSIGDSVDSLQSGNVSITPQISTDSQSGTFFIDYMLGDNGNGLNMRRSDNHPISVNAPMTVIVTNSNDSGPGSLRQALSEVSSSGEILFNLTYPATIVLDSQLVIDRNLTITGPQTGKLTLSGNDQTRIFYIENRENVNISNLTITNGNEYNESDGGGILCYNSSLNLENVTITNNTAIDGGGIYCSESNVNLTNVSIGGNMAEGRLLNGITPIYGDGGGIYCENSNLSLSGVTLNGNSARNIGGGILFADSSEILFDTQSRSNIFFNTAVLGNDLYSLNNSMINVVLDTFSVLFPSSFYVYHPRNFSFDIINAKIIQYNTDLYVKMNGDNNNSGTSWSDAFKNISFAFSRIIADSLHPHTIFINDGIYSPSTTNENFPLILPDYVTLSGTSRENVIIDAQQQGTVIQICIDYSAKNYNYPNWLKQLNRIEKMTIKGGSFSGIKCWESNITLDSVIITGNNSSTINPSNYDPGGGIICEYSILNITDAIVSDNVCELNGGGIWSFKSDVNINSSEISNNSAGNWGGGIYAKGTDNLLNLTNVNILANSAGGLGGGIVATAKTYLSGTTIANNYAGEGGGIGFAFTQLPDITFDSTYRCNIYSNQAALGNDLYYDTYDSTIITVILDTFTVLNPTEENAYPIWKYDFNILHDASGTPNFLDDNNTIPIKFNLKQNYPNPFNPTTNIEFSIPKPEFVILKIYNILGQEVATLVSDKLTPGNYKYTWDAAGFASGIYYYKISAGDPSTSSGSTFVQTRKLILMK